MTDTNNTDGAALLPVTQAIEKALSALDDAAEVRYLDRDDHVTKIVGYADAIEIVETLRDAFHGLQDDAALLADANSHYSADQLEEIARHRIATQEDAERSGAEVEQAAWDWLAAKFLNVEAGYDHADRDYSADEMVDAFIAGRETCRYLCLDEDVERVAIAIRDVKQGLGFDYMDFCRDAARAALAAALSTPQRQEYDGEAVREALEPFACDDFETPITDEQGWTDFGLSWSKDRIRDWFGPSEFRRAREVYRAALAHPAQATPSALSGDAGEGE